MSEIEVQGLHSILIQLKVVQDKLTETLDKSMLEGANLICQDAINLINSTAGVPSKPGEHPSTETGNLVANITVEKEDDGYSVGSRSGAPYGLTLELGTSKVAARPWLYPTYQKNLSVIEDLIKNNLINVSREIG